MFVYVGYEGEWGRKSQEMEAIEYNLQTEKYTSHFIPTSVDSSSKDSANFRFDFLIHV